MPPENSVTLKVRHNTNTGDSTITGGVDDGANVDIFLSRANTITWNATGHEGRWGFDGIVITPPGSFTVVTSTARQIVVTESGAEPEETYTYLLRFRNIVTKVVKLQDPLTSNMIKKKAPLIVK